MNAPAHPAPHHDHWFWEGVEARADGPRIRLTHGNAELLLEGTRLTRGRHYATALPAVRRPLARLGAILQLRRGGKYLVHAAGCVDPAGHAWLLAGNSGSGKSTLAYALSRSGWESLGDDGVIVECRDDGVTRCHAWRDPLLVSQNLQPAFPELAGRATGQPAAGDPRARVPVRVPAARTAPLRAIAFLERGATDRTTPLAPTTALLALLGQSPWALIHDADAPRQLAAFRRISMAVPAFRLEHTSRQLTDIAATLAAAVA